MLAWRESAIGTMAVEIMDLTTGGARVNGIELPVGSQVTLDFIPPGRTESVSVTAEAGYAPLRLS